MVRPKLNPKKTQVKAFCGFVRALREGSCRREGEKRRVPNSLMGFVGTLF